MNEMTTFSGFPREGLDFLADLAANNNREWFQAHKQVYLDYLLEPAVDFVVALGTRLQALSPAVSYDTRTNGNGSLMRIYRDTRFSEDKTPYKTHVTMMYWEGTAKKTQNPGFYVRVESEGAGVFVGQHVFPKPTLDVYRDAVADEETGAELEAVLSAVRDAGAYQTGGEHYKRVPRGYDQEHIRADLLRYNGLFAYTPAVNAQMLTSPNIVDVCFEHCRNMAPLHRWLVKLAQKLVQFPVSDAS